MAGFYHLISTQPFKICMQKTMFTVDAASVLGAHSNNVMVNALCECESTAEVTRERGK